jgi:hypothetical protein
VRYLTLLSGAVLAAGVVAGCSSATPGTAVPTTQSSAPSSGVGSGDTAPKVAHPLDGAAFVAKPCSSLTPADTEALGLAGAQGEIGANNLLGIGCGFFLHDTGVNVLWNKDDTNGLTDLYALRSNYAYWIPTTVSGHPAVFEDGIDERSTGTCSVDVGVNDHLFFDAQVVSVSPVAQACPLAKRAAALVIKNLQAIQAGGG